MRLPEPEATMLSQARTKIIAARSLDIEPLRRDALLREATRLVMDVMSNDPAYADGGHPFVKQSDPWNPR